MANPNGTAIPNLDDNRLTEVKEEQFSPLRQSSPRLPQEEEEQQQESNQTLMDVKSESIEVQCGLDQFIKSVEEMSSLANAIGTFKRRFNELRKHVHFIQKSIDAKLTAVTSTDVPPQNFDAEKAADDASTREQPLQQRGVTEAEATITEPERLCRSMCGRGLRKYIMTNLEEVEKIREEIPAALKLAKNPGKLVLDCIGRFFLQGRKAYTQSSPMIPARYACILALECFARMAGDVTEEGTETEISVKTEAVNCAFAWKKRLMAEGGLRKADELDARGLVFFISGYGIPPGFKHEELVELIMASNPIEIANALKQSGVLVPIIPGIIEDIMKRDMHVEAVYLSLTFGLEDRFQPHSMLATFLQTIEEAFKQAKKKSQSLNFAKDANDKKLAALKSVVRCLESHKIDPDEFLPAWQIKEQIIKLEKDLAEMNKELDEKAISKRKSEETAFANRPGRQETKRPRFLRPPPPAVPSHPHSYHDQRLPNHLMRSNLATLVNTYLTPSSAIPNGLGHGTLQDNRVHAYAPNNTVFLPAGSHVGVQQQSYPVQQASYGLQTVYAQQPQPQPTQEYAAQPVYSSAGNPTTNVYGYTDAV